jgi:preprotein translocase subunit SecA
MSNLASDYIASNGPIDKKNKGAFSASLSDKTYVTFNEKIEAIGSDNINDVIQNIALMTLDYLWKEHLHHLDQVRLGINLRSYGQKNPLIEYKNEAFEAFKSMIDNFEEQLLERIFRITIVSSDEANSTRNETEHQINRNKLCHCGSGKRYKHCHGAL